MLSIIICSKSTHINPVLEKNIQDTVGVEYELIVIDNSNKDYSIFSAYNKGIEQSKYPYICFVHEDVLFKSQNWGVSVCQYLKNPSIGIIGIAGGDLITRVPTSWSESECAKNLIQSSKKESQHLFFKPETADLMTEAVLLDGCWLCMSKDFCQQIKFDEKTFDGFHMYDIDICLQSIVAGYKNYVVFDVLIEHFSRGRKSREWILNLFKLATKWENKFPISSTEYTKEELDAFQKKSLVRLIRRMVRLGFTKEEILKHLSSFWLNVFPTKTEKQLRCKIIRMKTLLRLKML